MHLKDIVKELEAQQRAITTALEVLRGADGPEATIPPNPKTRKGTMTPEGRRRLSAALKARWAERRLEATLMASKKSRSRS